MNAFQTIIQKYYGQDKIFYLNKDNCINTMDFLQHVYNNKYNNKTAAAGFFYQYIVQIFVEPPNTFISKKFSELKKLVINPFMSEKIANALLDDFSQFQKIYNGFARFAHIYKFKKAKVQINSDLCMNELNPKKSNVFVLFQNNLKYYFSARDLINMFNSNLSHCISFVPDMIVSKNPYNNLILNETSLYNIYFFLRWNAYVIPELFHGFFLSNLNPTTFHHNYESNIINEYTKNFIYNSHHDTLYPIFKEMWETYHRITKKIIIDNDFPKDKLINIMKPYLHLYYISLYATNGTYKQCNAEYVLRRKLMRFRNFNSNFGRKYIRLNKDIFGKKHRRVEFDLKHINFYKTEVNNNNLSNIYNIGTQSNIYQDYPLNMIFIRTLQTRALYYFQPSDRIPSPSFDNDNLEPSDAFIQENNDDNYDSEYDSNSEEEKEDDLSIS
jgi:hypothetical protein